MSESSITSSPSKPSDSIRATRLKRRSKRIKIDQSMQINSDQVNNSVCFHNLLKELYNDSEDEPTGTIALGEKSKSYLEKPAIIKHFKPFELEKSLAMADHIFVQQFNQNQTNIFHETQGFVTCTNLTKVDNTSQCRFINNGEKDVQNDSFDITESELINCCNQVEEVMENVVSKKQDCSLHELTPKKKDAIMLVNSILEDFSQSPLGKEQIITNISWEYTPEFRLRRLPIKSYSRKYIKFARTNLVKRFEVSGRKFSTEYEDDISCCSSLSVQEDDTFCENPNNQSVATNLNNTERLCENLLNLTEYFTQNDWNQSIEEDQQNKNNVYSSNKSNDIAENLLKISDLIEEIFTLRSIRSNEQLNDSYDSSNDFNGFLNSENKMEQDTINKKVNLTPDFNDCDEGHANILKDKEENYFLADWNEDDCHDIFACINTEDVLQQNNMKVANKKRSYIDNLTAKSTNNDETFIIPKAKKTIEVSKEAHIMAAKMFSQLPSKTDFADSASFQNCDNKPLYKDENLFENPEDCDEWNDDCDLFLNFQTPIFFKENTIISTQQKLKTLIQSRKYDQDAPSTSKFAALGFTTAAGKNVSITSKGQATVQKLLNEFAGERTNNDYEEELKEIKFKAYAKAHNLETIPSSLSDIKQINEGRKLNTAEELLLKTTQNSLEKNALEKNCMHNSVADTNVNIQFQTASGKQVSISAKAKETAENLLKDFNTKFDVETCENDLKDLKTKILNKNNDLKPKTNEKKLIESDCKISSNKLNECPAEMLSFEHQNMAMTNMNTDLNIGLKTASGKQAPISIKAKQTIENLLKEFNTELDVENCENDLKDLKTKILNKNKDIKLNANQKEEIDINLKRRYNQLNKSPTEIVSFEKQNMTMINLNTNINIGFQTARGKQVPISAKAKQTVENLLKEFNTELDVETCEKDLKNLKTIIQNKNKDLRAISTSQMLNETTSGPKQQNDYVTPKLTLCKRRISIDDSELETSNKEHAEKLFKNDLQSSKSSFAEQSLKSPLISATRSIILRKNLLSLTKKRKNKRHLLTKPAAELLEINQDLDDLSASIETPKKSCINLKSKEPTPQTPNLKDFLSNASLTSTPRNNKPTSPLETFEDSDLKPINWKNDSLTNKSANISFNVTKLSDTSSLNVSFSSQNPTAKERIGRLKMYGKAPDVSPILIETTHNCRPSGLRRTRSMLQKNEK